MGEPLKFREPGEARGRPVSLRDEKLGVSWQFRTELPAESRTLGELIAAHIPVIRRYLDDPVNVQVIGRRPDLQRNAFMAMLLAIDRVGFEGSCVSVAPREPDCNPAGHAGKAAGQGCPLCAILRLLASMQEDKLLLVRKTVGHRNPEGRYVRVVQVLVEPGAAFPSYRDKVRRLSLPSLLMPAAEAKVPAPAAKPASPDAATVAVLASMHVRSWADLTFHVHADGFRVGEARGTAADLRLDRKGWALFLDLARGRGKLNPRTLGGIDPEMSAGVERLRAALKLAFPQIPGEPIEPSGGGYKAVCSFQPDEIAPDSGHWGG